MKKQRRHRSHWTRLGKSMLPASMSDGEKRRLRNRLFAGAAALLLVWLTFFDSHSLIKRIAWHHEVQELRDENAQLTGEIDRLEREVRQGLSDQSVERIAREEFGMRRPGETVYRIQPAD